MKSINCKCKCKCTCTPAQKMGLIERKTLVVVNEGNEYLETGKIAIFVNDDTSHAPKFQEVGKYFADPDGCKLSDPKTGCSYKYLDKVTVVGSLD